MITDADVTKLKKTFVTKDEFGDFRMEVVERFEAIEERLDELDEKVTTKLDHVLVSLDVLGGRYQHSVDEHRVGAYILARHDRQLSALSVGTGIVLPE